MYNVAGRDRTSDLSNNSWPCNHTEDFVWNWPNHPKFVTYIYKYSKLTKEAYLRSYLTRRILQYDFSCRSWSALSQYHWVKIFYFSWHLSNIVKWDDTNISSLLIYNAMYAVTTKVAPANNIWLQQRFHNVGGKLWKRWQTKLLQNIPGKFQECCHNVDAKRCKFNNVMETLFIHFDNVWVLRYSQCCGYNLSAIWANPHISYQDMLRNFLKNWRSTKWCPHHFTGWFYVSLPQNKCP